MDIAQKKKELYSVLDAINNDCNILQERLTQTYIDLAMVETMEDAKKFDAEHDLEEGLVHIRLF